MNLEQSIPEVIEKPKKSERKRSSEHLYLNPIPIASHKFSTGRRIIYKSKIKEEINLSGALNISSLRGAAPITIGAGRPTAITSHTTPQNIGAASPMQMLFSSMKEHSNESNSAILSKSFLKEDGLRDMKFPTSTSKDTSSLSPKPITRNILQSDRNMQSIHQYSTFRSMDSRINKTGSPPHYYDQKLRGRAPTIAAPAGKYIYQRKIKIYPKQGPSNKDKYRYQNYSLSETTTPEVKISFNRYAQDHFTATKRSESVDLTTSSFANPMKEKLSHPRRKLKIPKDYLSLKYLNDTFLGAETVNAESAQLFTELYLQKHPEASKIIHDSIAVIKEKAAIPIQEESDIELDNQEEMLRDSLIHRPFKYVIKNYRLYKKNILPGESREIEIHNSLLKAAEEFTIANNIRNKSSTKYKVPNMIEETLQYYKCKGKRQYKEEILGAITERAEKSEMIYDNQDEYDELNQGLGGPPDPNAFRESLYIEKKKVIYGNPQDKFYKILGHWRGEKMFKPEIVVLNQEEEALKKAALEEDSFTTSKDLSKSIIRETTGVPYEHLKLNRLFSPNSQNLVAGLNTPPPNIIMSLTNPHTMSQITLSCNLKKDFLTEAPRSNFKYAIPLRLEMFDNSEKEEKIICKKIIELRNTNEYLYGYCNYLRMDGKIDQVRTKILEYVERERKFLVEMLAPYEGLKRYLSRLNIIFDFDDPQKIEERKETAKVLKFEAQNRLKLEAFFIHELSRNFPKMHIPMKFIDVIKKKIGVNLTTGSENLVKRLILQVEGLYIFSVLKSLVFLRPHDQFVQDIMGNIEIIEASSVTIGNDDFVWRLIENPVSVSRRRINVEDISLISKPLFLKALQYVQHLTIVKTDNLSFFEYPFNQSFYYVLSQKLDKEAEYSVQALKIQLEQLPTSLNLFCNCNKICGKEKNRFLKSKWTEPIVTYLTARLKNVFQPPENQSLSYLKLPLPIRKLLNYIKIYLQSQLHNILERSFHDYLQFLFSFSIRNLEFKVTDIYAKLCEEFILTTKWHTKALLTITSKIHTKKGKGKNTLNQIYLEPKLELIKDNMFILLKKMHEGLTGLENIAPRLYFLLKPIQVFLWAPNMDHHRLKRGKENINELLDVQIKYVSEQMEQFEKYHYLLEQNFDHVLFNLKKMTMDKNYEENTLKLSWRTYEKMSAEQKEKINELEITRNVLALALQHYNNIYWEMLMEIKIDYDFGLFYLNNERVSAYFSTISKMIHDGIASYCEKQFILKMDETYSQCTIFENKFNISMNTLRNCMLLFELLKELNEANNQFVVLSTKIEDLKQRKDFLDRYFIKLPSEKFMIFLDMILWPKQFNQYLENKKSEFENNKGLLKEQMKEENLTITAFITKFTAEIEIFKITGLLEDSKAPTKSIDEDDMGFGKKTFVGSFDMNHIYTMWEKMEDITEEMADIHDRIEALNKSALMLDLEETKFDLLYELEDIFKPFIRLWEVASKYNNQYSFWMQSPFTKLNHKEYEKNIVEWKEILQEVNHSSLRNYNKPYVLSSYLISELDVLRKYLPIVKALSNEGMYNRHWEQISTQLQLTINPNAITLKEMAEMKLYERKKMEVIVEITNIAHKEFQVETSLRTIEKEFEDQDMDFSRYKNVEYYLIKDIDDNINFIQELNIRLISIKGNPYVTMFLNKMEILQHVFKQGVIVFDLWAKLQRLWVYLEPIFAVKDVAEELEDEFARYETVCTAFNFHGVRIVQNPRMYRFIESDGIVNQLERLIEDCEAISKKLETYIDAKRDRFGRFYFISNNEIIEIQSEMLETRNLNAYINKIFDGIEKLDFSTNYIYITGFESKEGEIIKFTNPIDASFRLAELTLKDIEMNMSETLRVIAANAYEDFQLTKDFEKWIEKWPGQIIEITTLIRYTNEINRAFNNSPILVISSLTDVLTQMKLNINFLTKRVRGNVTSLERIIAGSLIILSTHAIDKLDHLITTRVTYANDFNFKIGMRYTMFEEEIYIEMATTKRKYGYEYIGNSGHLIITPLTERCYVTLLMALHNSYSGMLQGPVGTGKTETTKELAKCVAKFCFVFNCSSDLELTSVEHFFKGLALTGGWSCFDEFNRMNPNVLSVVAQSIVTIQTAHREQSETVNMGRSTFVFDNSCGIFITMNPGTFGRSILPDNLKILFRPISMVSPDILIIVQGLLYSYGFLNAKELALKVIGTFKNAKTFLSQQIHYDFGLRAIRFVLSMAKKRKLEVAGLITNPSQYFKPITTSRNESEEMLEDSEFRDITSPGSPYLKSNSRILPSGLTDSKYTELIMNIVQKMKTGNLRKILEEKFTDLNFQNIKKQDLYNILGTLGKTQLENIEKEAERIIILNAMIDSNIPKLNEHDSQIFKGILRDYFKDSEATSTEREEFQLLVEESLKAQNLEVRMELIEKIYQLFDTLEVKHGIIVIGNTLSGKSSAIKILANSLNQSQVNEYLEKEFLLKKRIFQRTPALRAEFRTSGLDIVKFIDTNVQITKSVEADIRANAETFGVKSYYLNPKALGSKSLTGSMDEKTNKWKDGILTQYMRESVVDKSMTKKWIIFDGPIDTMWVENLNTLLDENKKLCLPNGEAIKLTADMNIILEVENLLAATPATVSRCGFVFLKDNITSPFSLFHKYLEDLPPILQNFKPGLKLLYDMFFSPINELFLNSANLENHSPITCKWAITNFVKLLNCLLLDFNSLKESIEVEQGVHAALAILGYKLSQFEAQDGKRTSKVSFIGNEQMFQNLMTRTDECLEYIFIFALTDAFATFLSQQEKIQLEIVIRRIIKENSNTLKVRAPRESIFDVYFDMAKCIWAKFELSYDLEIPKEVSYEILLSEGALYVPTIDNIKTLFFMEAYTQGSYSQMLTGESGAGKTHLSLKFIYETLKNMVGNCYGYNMSFSSIVDASYFQTTLHQQLIKNPKIGFTTPKNTKLVFMVDDMGMAIKDQWGVSSAEEVLRQYFDYKGWHDLQDNNFKTIEGCLFLTTLTLSLQSQKLPISTRISRHFANVNCSFSENSFTQIFDHYMQSLFSKIKLTEQESIIKELRTWALGIHEFCIENFKSNPRQPFYLFGSRDLLRYASGLNQINISFITDHHKLLNFCYYEITRNYKDKLSSLKEEEMFEKFAYDKGVEYLGQFINQEDPVMFSKGMYTHLSFGTTSTYGELESLTEADHAIQTFLNDPVNKQLKIVLFPFMIWNIIKILRIIKKPNNHGMIVGIDGIGKGTLTQIACGLADFPLLTLPQNTKLKTDDWHRITKRAMISAGIKEHNIALWIRQTDLQKMNTFIEDISFLMSNGNIPSQITKEDIEDFATLIQEKAKMNKSKDHIQGASDIPLHLSKFYTKVKARLRVILTISPESSTLSDILNKYPKIAYSSTTLFMKSWPDDGFKAIGHAYLKSTFQEQDFRQNIIDYAISIYHDVFDISEEFIIQTNQICYLTPQSYIDFLYHLKKIINEKNKHLNMMRDRYIKGIERLENADKGLQIYKKRENELIPMLTKQSEQLKIMVNNRNNLENTVLELESIVNTLETRLKERLNEVEDIKIEYSERIKPITIQYKSAVHGLKNITKTELMEFKATKSPSKSIKLLLEAMCIILNIPPLKIKKRDKKGVKLDYLSVAMGRNVLGNYDILERMMNVDVNKTLTQEDYAHLASLTSRKLWDSNKLCKHSKVAGILITWATSTFSYFRVCNLLILNKDLMDPHSINEERDKLEVHKRSLDAERTDFGRISEEIRVLKDEVNQYKGEIDRLNSMGTTARQLIRDLGDEKHQWGVRKRLLDDRLVTIVGDTILGAAALSYLGVFNPQFRQKLLGKWWSGLRSAPALQVVEEFNLNRSLVSELKIQSWALCSLPKDPFYITNAIILDTSRKSCICLDPEKQAVSFIKSLHSENIEIAKHADGRLLNTLEIALRFGKSLLVEDVCEPLDSYLEETIKYVKSDQKEKTKGINLGGKKSIEVSPDFELYMTSNEARPHFIPHTWVNCKFVNFGITSGALQEHLINIAFGCEKETILTLMQELNQEIHLRKETAKKLEDKILQELSECKTGELVPTEEFMATLSESRKLGEEMANKIRHLNTSREKLFKTREFYELYGKRGSILYFTICEFHRINNLYVHTLDTVINVYTESIKHGKRLKHDDEHKMNELLRIFTRNLFQRIASATFATHHNLLKFMFAFSILKTSGYINEQLYNFIIRGGGYSLQTPKTPESKNDEGTNNKSPEWLSTQIWKDIQYLSKIPPFDSPLLTSELTKRESEWESFVLGDRSGYTTGGGEILELGRLPLPYASLPKKHNIYKYTQGENINTGVVSKCVTDRQNMSNGFTSPREQPVEEVINQGVVDQYNQFTQSKFYANNIPQVSENTQEESVDIQQRRREITNNLMELCLIKCFNPHRIIPKLNMFIKSSGIELTELLNTTKCLLHLHNQIKYNIPILILLKGGNVRDTIGELKKQTQRVSVNYLSMGAGVEGEAEVLMKDCMIRGEWLVLENIHIIPGWFGRLEGLVDTLFLAGGVNRNFRLFLSSDANSIYVSHKLLINCAKVCFESARGIRTNLLDIYTATPVNYAQYFEENNLNPGEFRKLYFALAFYHSVVQERSKFGILGWKKTYDFNSSDWAISSAELISCMKGEKDIPYKMIKYLISSINYGGKITSELDIVTLTSMIQNLINPMVAKGLQPLTKSGRYVALEGPLNATVEYISTLPVDDPPEAFGLTASAYIYKTTTESMELLNNIILLEANYPEKDSDDLSITRQRDRYGELLIGEMEAHLTKLIDMSSVNYKYKLGYENTFNNVLNIEFTKYHALLNVIMSTFRRIIDLSEGKVILTKELENLSGNIKSGAIPLDWLKVAYPVTLSLPLFMLNLDSRIRFMNQWFEKGHSRILYQINAFFDPKTFLGSILQGKVRRSKSGVCMENVGLCYEPMSDESNTFLTEAELKENMKFNIYCGGLKLIGGQWNKKMGSVQDIPQSQLFAPFPQFQIKARLRSKIENERHKPGMKYYIAPVYYMSGDEMMIRDPVLITTIPLRLSKEMTVSTASTHGLALIFDTITFC